MSENILIAYYSWSGNTRKLVEKIHEITGGKIFEILPLEPYTDNYNDTVNQAKKEIRDEFRPVLKSSIDSIDEYTQIFIGSPVWWHTIAPPVATFLAENNFNGKQILPFCTHGGGGQGRIVKDISGPCLSSKVSDCMEIYGSGASVNHDTLSSWFNSNKIILK